MGKALRDFFVIKTVFNVICRATLIKLYANFYQRIFAIEPLVTHTAITGGTFVAKAGSHAMCGAAFCVFDGSRKNASWDSRICSSGILLLAFTQIVISDWRNKQELTNRRDVAFYVHNATPNINSIHSPRFWENLPARFWYIQRTCSLYFAFSGLSRYLENTLDSL